MHYEVAVVGGGAAGLSAALMLGRARRTVIVCDDGRPRNAVADEMHGFLSRDGTPPRKLLERARSDVQRYPSVKLVSATVEQVIKTELGFMLKTSDGDEFIGTRLLLANGVRDELPNIEGLGQFWGRSVFVCPFCDGWEVQDRRLAAYGNDAALTIALAQELYGWSTRLTACSPTAEGISERDRRWLLASGCRLVAARVRRLIGDGDKLREVELDSGEHLSCDALFIAGSLRQACSIATNLGCKIDANGMVVVDENYQSNVPGCYVAGDAMASVHQVIAAAATGVKAAISITNELLREEADALAGASEAAVSRK